MPQASVLRGVLTSKILAKLSQLTSKSAGELILFHQTPTRKLIINPPSSLIPPPCAKGFIIGPYGLFILEWQRRGLGFIIGGERPSKTKSSLGRIINQLFSRG